MNKKLLKSVAALFAVAVLGVSCSSPADGGNDGNGGKQTEITKANLISAVNSISYTFTEPAADTRAEGDSITWSFSGVMEDNTTLKSELTATVTGTAAAVEKTGLETTPKGALANITASSDNPFIAVVVEALNKAGFNLAATDVELDDNGASVGGAIRTEANNNAVKFTITVEGLKKVKSTHKLSAELETFLTPATEEARATTTPALILQLGPIDEKTWQ